MINVALLGFGRIGQMHAQNIYLNKTLNLLYVYEKIDKLRKKAKNLYNCKIEFLLSHLHYHSTIDYLPNLDRQCVGYDETYDGYNEI